MTTEFNDASHYGFFMTGTTLTSATGKYIRVSELVLAALRAQGVFDNMIDGTAPPTTDKLWLDKNTDPAVLKEWDATGSAWAPMTFERLFGRAIVTPLATPTGTADALVVAEPDPFIPRRMYSLTPVADNTGSATIQVTGVGTYAVKYTDGTDIEAQEFKAGNPTILLFTGVRFEVLFKVADIYEARDQAVAVANALPPIAASTMMVDNAAGTLRETKTFAEVRDLLDLKYQLVADNTGAANAAAALTAAVAASNHVRTPPGTYLINTNVTIPAGVTDEFDQGSVFNIGTGITVTWNGGIKAGPYQQIFSGDLVQSSYTSNSLTPYTLALRGNPQIEWASPWWFGAKGDGKSAEDGAITSADATLTSASASFTSADIGKYIVVKGAGAAGVNLITTIASINSPTSVELTAAASTTVSGAGYSYGTDDYDAFVCALFFGKVCYVPPLDDGRFYLLSTSLPVRRSQIIRGDGYASWMRLASFQATGVGQFIGIAGLLPTVSGGQPAAWVENVLIEGLHIDTNGGVNDNGIGGSMCRNVEVRGCFFSNVGRKAITWQYHVHNHYAHDCIVFSASKESGSTHSVLTTEGENSSFTYANGVAGFDHDGADNTGHVFRDIHIYESGYSGVTVTNGRRHLIDHVTIDALGSLGRPVIVGRVSKDNTFRGVKVKTSTRGFLIVTSATVMSTKFEDCWVQSCAGDNMFYSEGPGSEFINSGGTQTDDLVAWSIRGADCKIINCRADFTAITSATQAAALFSTAARFVMSGCYINSANALRGFGGSTAADIKILFNHFTGGATDGISISGVNFQCVGNTIGGNATNRVVTAATATNGVCTGNVLTGGASAQINFNNTSLFSSVKCNNPGDTNSGDNMFLGGSTVWVDSLGKLYIKASGTRTSDTDGTIVGTQS